MEQNKTSFQNLFVIELNSNSEWLEKIFRRVWAIKKINRGQKWQGNKVASFSPDHFIYS